MGNHPTHASLMEYVEQLTLPSGVVCVKTAAHIQQCDACAREVAAIRDTLALCDAAAPIEPSSRFSAELRMAVRRERVQMVRQQNRHALWSKIGRGTGYAATLLIVASLSFGAILKRDSGATSPLPPVVSSPASQDEMRSAQALEQASQSMRTLLSAVAYDNQVATTTDARAQWRAARAFDADITDSLDALKRNPGCQKARRVVNETLKRQEKALKTLYAGAEM